MIELERIPRWLEEGLRESHGLGKGAYAWVWAHGDDRVIKITVDRATGALLSQLRARPCAGFPVVHRGQQIRLETAMDGRVPAWAFDIERLVPLPPEWATKVKRLYLRAKSQTAANRDKRAYCIDLAEALKVQFKRHWREQPQVVRALCRLQAFLKQETANLDLLHTSNWMLNASGRIVLCDPVVVESFEF